MSAEQTEQLSTGRQYVNFEEFIDFHLQKTRTQVKATDVATAVVLCALGLLSYVLLFVVADHWLIPGGWPGLARWGMLTVVLGIITSLVVRRVIYPLSRSVNSLYAAREIERTDPSLKGTLLTFVDLKESGREQAGDGAVARAVEKKAAVGLSKVDVDHAIDRLPLLRLSYALLAVVAVSCLYVVLSPKDPFPSVRRALLPASEVSVATRTTISDLSPGDMTLPARSQLTVEADVRGQFVGPVQLLYTTADRSFVDQPLEMRRIDEGLPRFRGLIAGPNGKGLLQDLTYRIEAGDARTVDYAVRVVQPPSARVDEIRLVHPNYMQISPKTSPGGAIDGWEGAQVTLKATANMPVKSAVILLFDSEDAFARNEKGEQISSVRIDKGTDLTATWNLSLRSDGTFARYYRLQVETANGARDPEPTQYPIKIRPDQPPEIALLHPTSDLERPANITLPLAIQASDADFGLRTIALRMEKNGEGLPDVRLFEDQELGQSIRGRYDWDLARMGLKAGDVVQFWLEARDTKQPNANKRVTNRLNLKIVPPVSPQEAKQQLAEDKQAQQDQLAQADPERDQPPEAPAEAKPEEGEAPQPAGAPARPEAPRPKGDNKNDAAENDPPAAEKADQPEAKKPDAPTAEEKQPADDSKALERFIRELEQEQQRQGNPDQPAEKPEGEPGAEGDNQPGKPDGDRPAADRPNQQPPGKSPPGKSQPEQNNPGKKQPGVKQPQQGEGAAPQPGQAENGGQPKGEPPANQPGRKTGGENRPSKQPNPNDSSDTEPAEPGKAPSQTRERPGTDEATGANSPTPSNNGKPSPNRSTNPKGPPEKGGKPGEATEPATQEPGAGKPGDKTPGDKKPGEKTLGNDEAGDDKAGEKQAGDKPGRSQKPGMNDRTGTAAEPSESDPSKPGTKPAGEPKETGEPGEPGEGQSEKNDSRPGQKPGDKAGQPRAKPGETPSGKGPGPKPAEEPGTNEPRPEGDPSAPREQPAANESGQGSEKPSKKPGDGKRDRGDGVEKPKSKPGQNDEPMPEGVKPDEGGDAAGEAGGKPDMGAKPKPGEAPKPGAEQPEPGQPGAPKPTEKPGRPEGKSAAEGDKPNAEDGDPQAGDPADKPGNKPEKAPGKPGSPKEGAGDKPSEKPAGQPSAKPGEDGEPGDPSADKPEGGKAGQKPAGKPGQPDQKAPPGGEKTDGMEDGKDGAAGQNAEQGGEKEGASGKKPGQPGSPSGKPGQSESGDGQPGEQPAGQGKPGQGKPGEGKPGQGKPGQGKAGEGKPGEGKPGPGDAGSDDGGGNSPAGEKPGAMPDKNQPDGKAAQEGSPEDKQPDSKGEPGKAGEKANGGGQKPGGEQGGGKESGAKDAGGQKDGVQPGKSGGQGQPGGSTPSGKGGQSGNGSGGTSDSPNGDIGTTDRPRGDRDRRGEGGDRPGEEGDSDRPVPGEALTKDEKADAAKLEYTKKASNLVLQRLKEQLERGEVDPETLKELGWTKEELAKFVDRLEKRMEAAGGEEDSPEAVARRMQFEEELKQLRVGNDVKKRTESGAVQRRTNITNKQAPVPPELRDQYDAYTKGLSKTGGAKTGGAKPGDAAKPGVPASR